MRDLRVACSHAGSARPRRPRGCVEVIGVSQEPRSYLRRRTCFADPSRDGAVRASDRVDAQLVDVRPDRLRQSQPRSGRLRLARQRLRCPSRTRPGRARRSWSTSSRKPRKPSPSCLLTAVFRTWSITSSACAVGRRRSRRSGPTSVTSVHGSETTDAAGRDVAERLRGLDQAEVVLPARWTADEVRGQTGVRSRRHHRRRAPPRRTGGAPRSPPRSRRRRTPRGAPRRGLVPGSQCPRRDVGRLVTGSGRGSPGACDEHRTESCRRHCGWRRALGRTRPSEPRSGRSPRRPAAAARSGPHRWRDAASRTAPGARSAHPGARREGVGHPVPSVVVHRWPCVPARSDDPSCVETSNMTNR